MKSIFICFKTLNMIPKKFKIDKVFVITSFIYFFFCTVLTNFFRTNPLILAPSFFPVEDLNQHKTTLLILSRMQHDKSKILNKLFVSFNKRYKTHLNLLAYSECLLLKDDRLEFVSLFG